MDNFDEPRDATLAVNTDDLSLPLAVLGDLPARARFHRSQDEVARAMQSLLSRCEPLSAS